MAADWKKIKTEYITTNTSYRKLAQKYGVGYQAICHRSQAEGWIEQREQHRNKTISKTLERISDKQASKMSRIDRIADSLLEKIEQAVEELDMRVIVIKEKEITSTGETTTESREAYEGGIVDRAGLRQITAALKDLKDIKMIRSEADMREQEARIRNLQRQAEREDDDKDRRIVVSIAGGDDAWAK